VDRVLGLLLLRVQFGNHEALELVLR
jgi:hypothetical protein